MFFQQFGYIYIISEGEKNTTKDKTKNKVRKQTGLTFH